MAPRAKSLSDDKSVTPSISPSDSRSVTFNGTNRLCDERHGINRKKPTQSKAGVRCGTRRSVGEIGRNAMRYSKSVTFLYGDDWRTFYADFFPPEGFRESPRKVSLHAEMHAACHRITCLSGWEEISL